MANYAYVDPETKVVTKTIVADSTYLATKSLVGRENWIEFDITSGWPACIGGTYYADANKFIEKKPYDSWVLNSDLIWEAPLPMPITGIPYWDEAKYQENKITGWVCQTPVGIAGTSDAQEFTTGGGDGWQGIGT